MTLCRPVDVERVGLIRDFEVVEGQGDVNGSRKDEFFVRRGSEPWWNQKSSFEQVKLSHEDWKVFVRIKASLG